MACFAHSGSVAVLSSLESPFRTKSGNLTGHERPWEVHCCSILVYMYMY